MKFEIIATAEDGPVSSSAPTEFEPTEFEPTKDQAEGIEKIGEFLEDPKRFAFGLFGFAGTGKTFSIFRAIDNYSGRVAACAPTHKAVGVLGSTLADSGRGGLIRVETFHKMLSLRKQYEDGKTTFVPDPKRVPMVESYDLLIVDECSMIGPSLDRLLRPYIEGESLKVIFMGDPLQLPPVEDGEELADSPTFDVPESHRLTEVVRNGGVIGEAIAGIRENISAEIPPLARPGRDERGEIELYGSRMWFRKFLEEVDAGADVQALAFTNRSVDWINANVRKHLFGKNPPPFVEGERLVAVETFEQFGSISFYTGDTFTVVAAEKSSSNFELAKESITLECWELEIEFPDGRRDVVDVLDEEQRKPYTKAINQAREDGKRDRTLWGYFYRLKEGFAKVRPGYATTIHKSQGSTYDRVYLAQSDVLQSADFDTELRNRLLYVGYSRTRSGLIIC